MSHFHEEQIRSSQAVRTDGRELSSGSFLLLFWLNAAENLEFHEEQIRSSPAVCMDGGH